MAKNLKAKLKKIKILLLDIDGIMTDARILWIEGTGWTSFYNVRDGFGIRQLLKHGVEVGFISGGNFPSMRKRAEVLGVKHLHLGDENKVIPYEKIKAELGLKDEECAFMGDELFDLGVLRKVGFSASVPDAAAKVKKSVHYVTKRPGGAGAVREVIDMLMDAKGIKLEY